MNLKTFISLLVAVCLGLAAVWVGRELILGKSQVRSLANTPMTKVVVAKHDLEPGQLLNINDDLTIVEMPTDKVPAKAFTDRNALTERAMFYPAVKGQIMFEGLLAKVGTEGGLTALVPKGLRAVSVEVNESSGVSGLLVPGCHVDVIATLRQSDGNSQMARTIVENAKVQAVGPRLTPKGDERGPAAKTVTLIVPPKDAEAIELASTFGRPRLVLRGTADTDRTASVGVTNAELTGQTASAEVKPSQQEGGWAKVLEALMSRGGSAQPTAQPVRWPVQIIRGNNESTIFYELKGKSAGPTGSESERWVSSSSAAPGSHSSSDEKAVERNEVR